MHLRIMNKIKIRIKIWTNKVLNAIKYLCNFHFLLLSPIISIIYQTMKRISPYWKHSKFRTKLFLIKKCLKK